MSEVANKKIVPSNKGTKQIFENKLLERLSRNHILIPISILTFAALAILYWGLSHNLISIVSAIYIFVIGLLAFTLVEYLVHRYIFHMVTDTKRKEKFVYAAHGVHHEYPKDKDRLAMPPPISVAISTVLFFLLKFIMGNIVYAFLPGFLIGYCAYLGVHYIVHAFQPPKNFFKVLWIHHGIHHYKDHERAFGVSSPLWDYIFRTMPK